jgi:predicted nicotinamide N-methyase
MTAAAAAAAVAAAAADDDDGPLPIEVVEEEVDLGPVLGTLRLKQLAPSSFNEACKSTTTKHAATAAEGEGGTDCTGQRVYAGCQTMVRFLAHHPWLVRGQSVVELGCGVGACGLALAKRLGARRVVLTDGQPSTLDLARANAEALGLLNGSQLGLPHVVSVRRLLFGSDPDGFKALLAEEGLGAGADVVVGNELMYYNVDPAAVLTTAAALLCKGRGDARAAEGGGGGSSGDGLILLAHIFRGAHLPKALADAAEVKDPRIRSDPSRSSDKVVLWTDG